MLSQAGLYRRKFATFITAMAIALSVQGFGGNAHAIHKEAEIEADAPAGDQSVPGQAAQQENQEQGFQRAVDEFIWSTIEPGPQDVSPYRDGNARLNKMKAVEIEDHYHTQTVQTEGELTNQDKEQLRKIVCSEMLVRLGVDDTFALSCNEHGIFDSEGNFVPWDVAFREPGGTLYIPKEGSPRGCELCSKSDPTALKMFVAAGNQHNYIQQGAFGPLHGGWENPAPPQGSTILDVPPGGTFYIVLNGMSDAAGQFLVDAVRLWLKALGRDGFVTLQVTRDLSAPQPRVVVQPMGTLNPNEQRSLYGQAFAAYGQLELTSEGHNPLTAKHEFGHIMGIGHINAHGTMHSRALSNELTPADLAMLQALINSRHQPVTQMWNAFFQGKD